MESNEIFDFMIDLQSFHKNVPQKYTQFCELIVKMVVFHGRIQEKQIRNRTLYFREKSHPIFFSENIVVLAISIKMNYLDSEKNISTILFSFIQECKPNIQLSCRSIVNFSFLIFQDRKIDEH